MPPYTIRFKSNNILELGGGNNPVRDANGNRVTFNMDIFEDPNVDLVHDLGKFPWPIEDNYFDGVFSKYCIEHIPYRDVPKFISEIFRVSKIGAKIIVFTSNTFEQCKTIVEKGISEGSSELLFGSQEFEAHAGCHKSAYSEEYAKELFEKAGFNFVKVLPHPVSSTDLIIECYKIPEDQVFERGYFDGGGYGYIGHYRDFATHFAATRILMHGTDPPPESVLDVGGARGYITRILENNGIRSVCMDISKHCWHNRATDSFILHDIRQTPWPVKDKSFDMTFSINLLEHIEEEHLDNVIKEMARVSNRGIHGIHFTESPFEELDEDLDITHATIRPKSWWEDKFKTVAPRYTVYLVHPRMLEYEEPERQPPVTLMPPSPDSLVKLNCGSFKDMFYYWINIDIIDLKQFAEDQAYDFLQHDVRKGLPYDDESVDIIFSSHMLEHITRDEGKQFLKECYRVLKPGGMVRISTPNALQLASEYIAEDIMKYKYINVGVEQAHDTAEAFHELLMSGHKTVYDVAALSKILKEVGFRDIKSVGPFESRNKVIKTQTINNHPGMSAILEAEKCK